jgi:hypothetical protein
LFTILNFTLPHRVLEESHWNSNIIYHSDWIIKLIPLAYSYTPSPSFHCELMGLYKKISINQKKVEISVAVTTGISMPLI